MYAAALVAGPLMFSSAADASPTAEQLEQSIAKVTAIQEDASQLRDLAALRRLADGLEVVVGKLHDAGEAMPPMSEERRAASDAIHVGRDWIADVRSQLAIEEPCRTSDYCMGIRVCEAVDHRTMLMTSIAEERANPAGVVDLRYLHQLGQGVQDDDKLIASRKAWFAFARHKPWTRAACTPPAPADAGAE